MAKVVRGHDTRDRNLSREPDEVIVQTQASSSQGTCV